MAQAQILQQLPCSPTSPSGRSNIPLNEDARDIRDISQKWDDKKSSMQEDEPRADTLDEPLQSTKPGTGFSHKSKLSPREYKKRQLYKAAWKSFMTSMEDFSEESGEELETDKLRASTEVNQIGNAQVVNENAQKAPEVLYKADFYHYSNNPITGDQVPIFSGSRKSDKPILTTRTLEKPSRSNGQSILEFTTLYAVPDSNASSIASSTPATVLAEVGIYMVIRSKMILNILKSIIPYYPRRSFLSDELVLAEPFCVLLHYLEELKDRREKIEQESLHRVPESDDTPALHKHLTYLVNFVSEAYAHSLSNERARHLKSPAMCTYDWIWLLFRPGTVVYEWSCGNLTAYVVESHSKDEIYGIDQNPQPPTLQFSENIEHRARPKCLTIYVWHLVSNGEVLGREQKTFRIDMFEGEREILSLPIVPQSFSTHMNYMDPDLSTEESLIRRGKLFFALIKGCYKEYNGETAIDPKRSIHGRIMIDSKLYYETAAGALEKPDLISTGNELVGLVGPLTILQTKEITSRDTDNHPATRFGYENYHAIDPRITPSLHDEQYLLCDSVIPAFVLKDRKWEIVNVKNIQDPIFQVDSINDLVLDPIAKTMVKALSQRYTREKESNVGYSADFIRNKGEGQIFLLHGKPGVGKTSTAECVAELTKRPLLSLTCGDLGIEPVKVEQELSSWFQIATSWDAILLLDEADVYLESRITQDLQRNTLVSIFLRALEYYQGILFLTTNRVGTFDDGFISRIHVIIHYPDFSNEQRGQIWDIFFNKLEREREDIKVTQRILDYAKESDDMKSLGWNGREIRNAFNTALSLAECDNERDARNRIVLHSRHLEQVVKMSKAFQGYLKSTQRMTPAEAAYAARTRDDKWKFESANHAAGLP